MEETIKSYKQIFAFCNAVQSYMNQSAENKSTDDTTKLDYAIERTFESVQPKTVEYVNRLKDLKLDFALEDDKGRVQYTVDPQTGERTYEYSKEGLRNLDKAIEDLFNSEVSIKVHYSTSVPDTLPVMYQILFNGFVISPAKTNDEKIAD